MVQEVVPMGSMSSWLVPPFVSFHECEIEQCKFTATYGKTDSINFYLTLKTEKSYWILKVANIKKYIFKAEKTVLFSCKYIQCRF